MSLSQILGALVSAVVGGVVGSYMKPLAEHRFDELKNREQHQRDLIGSWRKQIEAAFIANRSWEANGAHAEDAPESLYGQAWFETLRSYLADDGGQFPELKPELNFLFTYPDTQATNHYHRLLNDEINELARKWKVNVKGRRRLLGMWW